MLLLLLALAAVPEEASSALVRLSNGVAEQRAAIETLADDVARERAASREEIAALERRRRELEARLASLRLESRELDVRRQTLEAAHVAREEEVGGARAPVVAAAARLKAHIDAVPFRLTSRGERCEVVARQIVKSTPEAGAAALWPIIVAEARLLSSISRARQPITVDDKPVMAEVAQVGPLVFWKDGDRTGFTRDGRFIVADDAETRQRLLLFFAALRRPSATGVFLLPTGGAL